MTDPEFSAFVSLLDDNDPEVRHHIEQRLLEMGTDSVPRLQTFLSSSSDTYLNDRIQGVIQRLQAQTALIALQRWQSDGAETLFDGWFALSRYRYPGLSQEVVRKELTRLASRTWLEMRYGMSAPEKFVIVNRMLFRKEMYRPTRKGVYDPECYFLNNILERRRGAPLSLCLLYALICQELDIPVGVILLPGYAVLFFHDNRSEFYIDVFNKGAFFSRADLKHFLEENEVAEEPHYYEPASNAALMDALIEILIEVYEYEEDNEQAAFFRDLASGLEE